jgi:hypothetical protein
MNMDKILDSEYDTGALHNVEGFVLERLLPKQGSGDGPLISIEDLIESTDTTMSPLLDQAIENLIAQSLIQSPDGENYQITQYGINEIESRKSEAIPL